MLDAARPHLLRVAGPNCLGIMVPGRGLNASFAHVNALKGDIALIAQSGAVMTSIIDWATSRHVGFSASGVAGRHGRRGFRRSARLHGGRSPHPRHLLYVEAITEARKFMSAARAAARQKPVIVSGPAAPTKRPKPRHPIPGRSPA